MCRIVDFAVPAVHRVKLKESKKSDKYLALARELKKIYGTWKWKSYQLYDQNSEKSLGGLRRFAVIQTQVRNHQLTLLWKILKQMIVTEIFFPSVLNWRPVKWFNVEVPSVICILNRPIDLFYQKINCSFLSKGESTSRISNIKQ